ncbi:hypothetical protein BJY16_003116 [Actinoplanes octamycinicus]|uniref:Uncharacterized protein n=1 Tax=Actinoplanes octamycinicus TaxID=135948 RepID=A0A7W7GWW3_9ACTN|nr:hypothetical protein [Actinoplanes octamycinicus]MBB4739657.1 hypothetical protein [Actinoplanes octamycinicus]GIE54840.1 hypothetical protein Aoc01nite_02420 [Actinoplanes octamycinicus]
MTVLFAHTYAEAYLFIDLTPCECGETRFAPAAEPVTLPDGPAHRWYGPCPRCGRDRAFVFRFATYADRSTPGYVEYSHRPEPSELLDARQWLWVSEQYAATVPLEVDALRALPRDEQRAVKLRLSAAESALAEAAKFGALPAGLPERRELFQELLSILPDLTDEEFWGAEGGYREKIQRLAEVRAMWAARHGLTGTDDDRATPEQEAELVRAERAASDLDVATGFSTQLPAAAVAAYNRLPWLVKRHYTDPAERDRRLAAVAATRAGWLARTGHPGWDPDSYEDEFDIPADRLPPVAETWEMVRAAREAAGMDPFTGEWR